jgi:hypothetical protein
VLISPTASDVPKLIGLYDALVTADANDQTATAAVQAKLDALRVQMFRYGEKTSAFFSRRNNKLYGHDCRNVRSNGLDIRACAGRVQCVSS